MATPSGTALLNYISDAIGENILSHHIGVVVAHPDDETIGCGGVLQHLPMATIVHVTDGSPESIAFTTVQERRAYADLRKTELIDAMSRIGVDKSALESLGIVDLEAFRHLHAIIGRLTAVIASRKLSAIITHSFEGGHPDHDAVAFASALAAKRGDRSAALFEMPFYRLGPDGHCTQDFAPEMDADDGIRIELTPAEVLNKVAMMSMFVSQREILASFRVDVEAFRVMPSHNFGVLPNQGDILYERFNWGVRSKDVQAAMLDILEGSTRVTG